MRTTLLKGTQMETALYYVIFIAILLIPTVIIIKLDDYLLEREERENNERNLQIIRTHKN